MDPEQTFLRVHARLSGMLSQLLTPRIRLALEYVYFGVAVALFCLLVVMHTNFVQQPGCSSEFTGIEFHEAQLVQIKITGGGLWAVSGMDQSSFSSTHAISSSELNADDFTFLTTKFWSNWIGSGARRSKVIFRPWKADKEFLEQSQGQQQEFSSGDGGSLDVKATADSTDIKAAVVHFMHKWCRRVLSLWRNGANAVGQMTQVMSSLTWRGFLDTSWSYKVLRSTHVKSSIVHWLERRSKAFEPTYLYSVEKGYFLLSEGAKARHGVKTINVTISAQNSCFGNRWQQLLINALVGYDTILTNSLLNSPGQGYLYNFQTKEFYDLSYGHEPAVGPTRFGDYFVTKCGVLIMSLFVFFTTTMSVSFTLRETQSRMLKFTVQLQHHARHRLPTFQLIFVHVIESLVFVPIMIGILFFLFEFYDDQMLAFLVLTLVWLCELFTMISVRTSISMQFFPRFFLLYFLVFHIYFFSYAYGFSYLAFSATAAFMQHLILYFWNRFEVPALQRFIRSRGQLQQPGGVHITSSTIYTSTIQIARVNMREPPPIAPPNNSHNGAGSELEPNPDLAHHTEPAADENVNVPPGGANNPLNPFGSLLLWLLGGGASDGIVSFFSMFRDTRDQPQDFNTDPPQDENAQVT
ncbi:Membralin [Rhynchospora pubera]|uniref:Membralin n=1 Tax=Rhynchospora pubera TaxID=906938 RepID=A0AAV8GK99_9POAL|nr:Membralin [Rhynchospora pubera]